MGWSRASYKRVKEREVEVEDRRESDLWWEGEVPGMSEGGLGYLMAQRLRMRCFICKDNDPTRVGIGRQFGESAWRCLEEWFTIRVYWSLLG